MTQYISDIPLSSIQNVSISNAEEEIEIDILEKDSNILAEGAEEAQQIEIEFTLLKQTHPERMEIEEQQDDVKELASNDVSENYFKYSGYEYFLAIGDISIAEEASMDTIREGTISATALPWPKHYPNADRGINKRNSGSFDYNLDLDLLIEKGYLIEGGIQIAFDSNGYIKKIFSKNGNIDISFNIQTESSKLSSSAAHLDIQSDFVGIANERQSTVSDIEYIFNTSSIINRNFRTSGSFEIEFLTDTTAIPGVISTGLLEITNNLIGETNIINSSEGDLNLVFYANDVPLDLRESSVGHWEYVFDISASSNLIFPVDSSIIFSKIVEGVASKEVSGTSQINAYLDVNATLETLPYGEFGRYFGRSFGGET